MFPLDFNWKTLYSDYMFKIAKINTITGIAKYLDFQEFIFPAGEVSVKLNAKDYAYKTLDLPNTIIARIYER